MTVEDLLQRLEVVRRQGHGWTARCPAHSPDRHPSLSVHAGDRGILVKCWAGCSLAEICMSLGIKPRCLFYDAGGPVDHKATRRAQVKRQAERLRLQAMGRQADVLREAEAVIRAATNLDISKWSDAQLDVALARVCDAQALLLREDANAAQHEHVSA